MFALLLVSFSGVALAEPSFYTQDEYRREKDWAHASTSFALQAVTYGFSKQLFQGMDRDDAVIYSAFTTFTLTFLYEAIRPPAQGGLDSKTILMNALGQSLAIGSIYIFEF